LAAALEIDVFWSFRSPWSYLATPRLRQWREEYELNVRFRPVYPIAIRTPDFFQKADPLWFSYFATDIRRVAEFLELPFQWPSPDPVASRPGPQGLPDYSVEQPHIHRLTRLGVAAEESGRGIEFADEISRLLWSGTKDWHAGDHLARASKRAGLDLADLDASAANESSRIEAAIETNQADHQAAGHWGVPTCAFRGEPFFGQDRLDVLFWRLEKNGLEQRSTNASSQ
jgi:2-hydroxychromene-2-carboxylate isomerase